MRQWMWHFGLPWEIFSKWNLLMEWSFISLTWWRKSKPMNEEMIKRASSFIAFQSKWFSVLLRIFYIFKRLFFRKPFIFFLVNISWFGTCVTFLIKCAIRKRFPACEIVLPEKKYLQFSVSLNIEHIGKPACTT